MAVTTSNTTDYSKVVFSNSTAAANLSNNALTEDSLGVVSFDVLAASGGGAKTTLWSVDDGDVDVAAPAGTTLSNNFASYDTDLLYKDLTGFANAETTAVGGKFWIEGGLIKYDASGIDPDLINGVAVGSTFTDTFKYTIRMSNGTLSVGTLSVNITNNEDGPVVGTADLLGAVTEDGPTVADDPNTSGTVETGAFLTDTGAIAFHDDDLLDKHTATVTADAGNTEGGTLTASVNEAAGDGTVSWVYSNDNANTQHLGAGDTAVEKFTVTISDGHTGGTVDQVVEVTITGVNDDASITGDHNGGVTEDGTLTDSGTLVVHDVDDGEAHTVAVAASAHNSDSHLGSYSVDADGGWSYTVDNALIQHLGDGIHTSDSFDVVSLDGTATQAVTIDIVGVNDAADITDVAGGDFSVTEDSDANAGGTLLVLDVDDDESAFDVAYTTTGTDGANQHGSFTFDAVSGDWTYLLNNNDPAVQSLNDGDAPLTDSYTVQSLDGTEHTITVNIYGQDEIVTLPDGGNTVGHDDTQQFTLTLDAAQHGVGANEAHAIVQLDALPDGFNFTGTIDFTVTGDIDAANEHVFVTFENGVQTDSTHQATGSESWVDVAFSSADSTLDLTYHTSSAVDGSVQITGVASYHYETPV